jgi:hypothetical protein
MLSAIAVYISDVRAFYFSALFKRTISTPESTSVRTWFVIFRSPESAQTYPCNWTTLNTHKQAGFTISANQSHAAPVYTFEMTETEQKIIRKAAAGDRLAFRELVLEHSHAMFRLAWRLTCDESTASGGMHKSGFIGNTVNATGIHRRHASIAMVTG